MKLWEVFGPQRANSLAQTDAVGPIDRSKIRRVTGAFGRYEREDVGRLKYVQAAPKPEPGNTCIRCKVEAKAVTKSGRKLSYCRKCCCERTTENKKKKEAGIPLGRHGRPLGDGLCSLCKQNSKPSKSRYYCQSCQQALNRDYNATYREKLKRLKNEKAAQEI